MQGGEGEGQQVCSRGAARGVGMQCSSAAGLQAGKQACQHSISADSAGLVVVGGGGKKEGRGVGGVWGGRGGYLPGSPARPTGK